MKRILSIFLTTIIILSLSMTAFASSQQIDIFLNQEVLNKGYINEDGIVMVPLREIAEKLGYNIMWDGLEKSVIVSNESNVLRFRIGETNINVNGERFDINSEAILKDGKTFVPIELFSKAFNLIIGWDKKNQVLRISEPIENTEEFFAKTIDEEIYNKLDVYMKALEKNQNFNGAVLVAQGGNILLNEAYGYSDFEQGILNKTQTKFAIGSITKQFTAMAIMQLYEKGLINVEDSLSKYLPDFPNGDLITIHNLLTHSSGLVNFTDLVEFYTLDNKDSKSVLNLIADKPLLFNPGERFNYSNTNYLILGILVEQLSGMSYEEYLQKNIFEPLNMNNTGICYGKDNVLHDATAYTGFLEVIPIDDEILLRGAHGAGSMCSTVEDLYKWDQALKTEKLVSKETLNKIFTEHISIDGGSYGYGWMIADSGIGKIIYHGGNTFGFSANIARLTDLDLTIIILSNIGSYDLNSITNTLVSIVLGGPYELPKAFEVADVDASVYDEYVGEYELSPGVIITITKEDNRIFAQITGQQKAEIFPASETEFFYKLANAKITFTKDDEGKVIGLVIYQMGIIMQGTKIK